MIISTVSLHSLAYRCVIKSHGICVERAAVRREDRPKNSAGSPLIIWPNKSAEIRITWRRFACRAISRGRNAISFTACAYASCELRRLMNFIAFLVSRFSHSPSSFFSFSLFFATNITSEPIEHCETDRMPLVAFVTISCVKRTNALTSNPIGFPLGAMSFSHIRYKVIRRYEMSLNE